MADGLGAIFLTLYALLIGPLGILRGPLVMERFLLYLWVLVPLRSLSRTVRAASDWRVGNFSLAIVQLESIILAVQETYKEKPTMAKRRVLVDLYTVLTRSYLHVGDIDKGMQVILQVQKHVGVDRLPGLSDLDAKTAHLIRAGIAAGRLLEGGGLATMFIKSDGKSASPPSNSTLPETNKKTSHEKNSPIDNRKKEIKNKSAQIIPFPLR